MQESMQKLSEISEKALFWLLIALLMFVPLFMKFPLFGVTGTFVSVRAEDVLIFIAYIVWAIYLISSGKIRNILSDRLIQAILLFLFIGALSLFVANNVIHTISLNVGLLHYLRRVELLLLLPFAATAVRTKRQFYVVIGVLILVLSLVLIYGMGQKYLNFPVISTTNSELAKGKIYYLGVSDRLGSTFAGHYDLAVYLLMAITIMSAVFFHYFSPNKKKLRKNFLVIILIGVLSVLSMVVLMLTAARLSFIAVIAGVIGSLVLVGKRKYVVLILIVATLGLVYPSQLRDRYVSTINVLTGKSTSSYEGSEYQREREQLNIPTLPNYTSELERAYRESIANVADIVPGEPEDVSDLGVYRSLSIRLNVEWPRAIRAFIKNPLTGTGYSSIGLATDNDILRSLGEVGLLGTWAFVLVLIETLRRLFAIYREKTGFGHYFTAGIIAMLAAFLINSLFIDVFEASKVAALLWMVIGVNLSIKNYKV